MWVYISIGHVLGFFLTFIARLQTLRVMGYVYRHIYEALYYKQKYKCIESTNVRILQA